MALLGAQGSPAAHVAGPFAAARALFSSSGHRYLARRESSLFALPPRRAAFPVHFTLLARCPRPHHVSPPQREHRLPRTKAGVTKGTAQQPGHGMRPGKPRGSCFAAICLGSFSVFTLLLVKLVQSYRKYVKGGLIT